MIETFKNILTEAIAGLENDIYTNMLMAINEGADDDVRKVVQTFVHALNRRGVSSRVIFEAMMETAKEFKKDE